MSTRLGDDVAASWPRRFEANARATLATLLRPPRRAVTKVDYRRLVFSVLIAAAAVLACMIVLDRWAIAHVHWLPLILIQVLNDFTDLAQSGFFLWPLGGVLVALALLDSFATQRFARLVMAAWAVRIGFILTAIAVPGVVVAFLKRAIGRARPFVEGSGVWSYQPFNMRMEYASLPSGHAATAFAVVVAVGALLPWTRPLMWIYGIVILISRVAIDVHYPSDTIAGALIGAAGALLVREWFAARGLGFVVARDGSMRPLPGPSVRRIVQAIETCLHSIQRPAR